MVRKVETTPEVTGVAAADRVLTLLTAFRRGDEAVELAELAERTGLVKSTIMRLSVSLERFGLLVRLPGGRYRLGAETLRLGAVYQHSLDIEPFIMPVLERLVTEIGETASFYVQHGEFRLCLYRVDSPHNLRIHIQPGDIRPMDQSAVAQVLRKFARKIVSDDTPPNNSPIYSPGVTDPHTASLAMPVFAAGPRLVGALAVSGPVTRLSAERAESVIHILNECGLQLTERLGGGHASHTKRPRPKAIGA